MQKTKSFFMAAIATLSVAVTASAQTKVDIIVDTDRGTTTISRHIFGQFTEHLGNCIYGGMYVGENSSIPNTGGVRNDMIKALKEIRIPNLRWPGGCFADEYHWRDGVGPKSERPKMVNTNWGGVVEDNSFGTHEFLALCELLGTEPYITGNVGSGTVEEMNKWIEYMTFDGDSPMTRMRKANGREKPWTVHFFGVGNESWGCGGNMMPETYAAKYRQYQTFCKNYSGNTLRKIASGPNVADYNWTETIMQRVPAWMMWGISLHHYSFGQDWDHKGSATKFDEKEYIRSLDNALMMDELITKHSTIMDKYDPEKRVALVVDEWGGWYETDPNNDPPYLYCQQNTLRDAILAALTLNVFEKHADRVRVANLAQMVNVLHSLFITKDEKMILTPTYHIFNMYKVHQDATLLPSAVKCPKYECNFNKMDQINVAASKDKEGMMHISLVNVDPHNAADITCSLRGTGNAKLTATDGQIITSAKVTDYNSFANPNNITLQPFKDYKLKDGVLTVKMPAKSVITITVK